MSTDLDRLCEEIRKRYPEDARVRPWPALMESEQRHWRFAVASALTALMTPSDAVVEAGAQILRTPPEHHLGASPFGDASEVWRAMLTKIREGA